MRVLFGSVQSSNGCRHCARLIRQQRRDHGRHIWVYTHAHSRTSGRVRSGACCRRQLFRLSEFRLRFQPVYNKPEGNKHDLQVSAYTSGKIGKAILSHTGRVSDSLARHQLKPWTRGQWKVKVQHFYSAESRISRRLIGAVRHRRSRRSV